jgi:hypothetical protein
VTLVTVAVMAAARSEARNAATSATCASRGARRSMVASASIRSRTSGSASPSPPTAASFSLVRVSTTPAVQIPTARTPAGPSSAAR